MWPHWPHDLWCQVRATGIFLIRPYFVVTPIHGSGTRCTSHSPAASSSKTFSRTSSVGGAVGPRSSRASRRVSRTVRGIGMPGDLLAGLEAGFFEQLFHDVVEDHVEPGVDALDHVQHPGHVPDQVELGQGLVVDLPGCGGGMHRVRRQGPTPQAEVVRDLLDVGPPVREGIRLEHVRRDLGPCRHDLVDDPAVALEGVLGRGQAVVDRDLAHDRDEAARVVAARAAGAREALRAVPDVVVELLVEHRQVLAGRGLGDLAGREVVETGRRAGGHADTALVAAVEVALEPGIGLDLAEQARLLLDRDIGVASLEDHGSPAHQKQMTWSASRAMSLKAAPPIILTPSMRSSTVRPWRSSDGWQT